MLKISPAVTVNKVPGAFAGTSNNYILFPDSEDKDLYYALAEQPTFLADGQNNPSFNLTWFFGSGVTPGGICTMTVALPMPDTNNAQVKSALLAAVKGDQSVIKIAKAIQDLCKAMDAGDAARVAQLKQELGFNDDAAAGKKKLFDKTRDWDQFLPDLGKFNISPVPFRSGTVTVQAFANNDAYVGQTPDFTGSFETTPSLFNSNAAVITFNLSERGANLFWHALGGWQLDPNAKKPAGYDQARGGSSVISVVYQVAFDGMLPEAKATVTLKHELFEKLDIETLVKNGSWGRTYREDVVRGKEFNEAINSATEIVLPAVATKDEKDSVQKLLTDWAAKQLEDMTKAQFPNISLNDLDINGARQIKSTQEQSRTYKLTQAVTLPKQPQAQLPKVDGLVSGEALKKFFQLIDLNDIPYINVGLTVRPPNMAYLKDRKVERFVLTALSYAGQKLLDAKGKDVTSIEFPTDAQQVPSQTYTGTFGKDNQEKTVGYDYLVAYTDGTPSFRAAAASQRDNNYLDLGSVDLGVLSVSLNAIDLPWDVISSAQVVLKYDGWENTVALTRSTTPTLVAKPFGQLMDKPLSYQLKLNLIAGAPVIGDVIPVPHVRGQAEITLRSPLGNGSNRLSFQLDTGVLKAQLRVEYAFRNSGPERLFNQVIQLDASRDGGMFQWTLPSDSDHPSALRVTKARMTTDKGSADLSDLSGGKLDPVDQGTAITVSTDGLSAF